MLVGWPTALISWCHASVGEKFVLENSWGRFFAKVGVCHRSLRKFVLVCVGTTKIFGHEKTPNPFGLGVWSAGRLDFCILAHLAFDSSQDVVQ
jgi:hypothetical protein